MQSRARLAFAVALAAYAGPAFAQFDITRVQSPPLSASDPAPELSGQLETIEGLRAQNSQLKEQNSQLREQIKALEQRLESFGPRVLWIYTAIGVAMLWAKMKRAHRSVYGLSDILDVLIPKRMKRLKAVTELFCYLFLGCIVVMGVVAPGTPAQALAAGLGWTSLTTR